MLGPSQQMKKELEDSLSSAIQKAYPGVAIKPGQVLLSFSKPKPELGDMSSSISFNFAKELKKAPQEIASEIASKAEPKGLVSSFQVAGGYINIRINREKYAELVLSAISERKDLYGNNTIGKGRKALIEFPSVNPSKPWHIGHLRNAVLGDVIANIMSASSFNVDREDYIEDLGLQIAESLWGWNKLGHEPDKKFDQWLGEQYVKVNKMLAEPGVKDEINAILKKMEDLSTDESKAARALSEKCVKAQYETAFNYGIYHDVMIWESDIVRAKLLEKTMKSGEEKGVFQKLTYGKYEGCIAVDLEKIKGVAKDFDNPNEDTKVLVRSNGTATYVAKDIAFHMWKFGIIQTDFQYSVMMEKQGNGKPLYSTSENGVDALFGGTEIAVNVIGSAQRYPQLILKSVMELMGYKKEASNIVHISYGEVGIEGGSLSGRKGGWMGEEGKSFTADTLLAEVKSKALELVEGSEKITDKSKSGEIANAVAVGAIKFEFLRIAPEKRVTFSWDKALDFESNSAPYCMYTYARARRILERAGYLGTPLGQSDFTQLTDGIDFELAKLLGEAPEMVEKACIEYRPNVITDYLLDLSSLFSRFYEKMQVIKGGDAKGIRLALVNGTMQVSRNMLLLLGINTVDSM